MLKSICFKPKKQLLVIFQEKRVCFLSKQISRKIVTLQENELASWTNIISALAQEDFDSEIALLKASQMLNSGSKPNAYGLVHLTRACARNGWFSLGQQLHCQILKSAHDCNVFVSTALIHLYGKFELTADAQNIFVGITEPSLVSWNSLISGYVHSGQFRKALNLFLQLEKSDLCADSFSFTTALAASGQLNLLQLGKSLHSKIVKLGVSCSVIVANCLIDMYGKCGAVEESLRAFDEMIDRDTISWNSIISASARNSRLGQALSLLYQMPDPDTISYNEVISGFAQFGNIDDAIGILCSVKNPNSSSWNSIITGYVNRGRTREALEFFHRMCFVGVQMDQYTHSSILTGIASIAAITWGSLIHCCTVKCGLDGSVVVGTALIDMYSKCGKMNEAQIIFDSLQKKNVITWNAIISGYAHNGDSSKVIQLFKHLLMAKDLQPDGTSFLHVLSAYWHSRMPLEAATWYFESMIKDYGIDPTAEHCSSVIRIMGQEGKVDRAEGMIKQLGFESCGVVWRALLTASVTCGNIEIAKVAAAKMIELKGENEYVYVLMSNLLACQGKWKDVGDIRALMKERNVRKEAGQSWIELENTIPFTSFVR